MSDLPSYALPEDLDTDRISRGELIARLEALRAEHPDNLAVLGSLAFHGKHVDDDFIHALAAALPVAEKVAASATLAWMNLWFGLARVAERKGEYADAWIAYIHGNEVGRRLHGTYPRSVWDQAFDKTRSVYRRKPPSGGIRGLPVAPLFVCGMPRSRTTLVEQILVAHPAVVTVGEGPWLEHTTKMNTGNPALTYLQAVAPPDKPLPEGTRYILDKTPGNVPYLGWARELFDDARFLIMQRDPLECMLSNWRTGFSGPIRFAFELDSIAHWFKLTQRFTKLWQRVLPSDRCQLVDGEALVADPEPAIRGLLDWLDLPFHEACLHPETVDRAVKTASQFQVREPIRPARLWAPHYAPFLRGTPLAPWL